MTIALDATYSVGGELSGVGIYSREILAGLAASHPGVRFRAFCRPHRFRQLLRESLPPNCGRGLFSDRWMLPPGPALFHALNQRMPSKLRLRRSLCTFHDLFVMTGDYSSPDFRLRFTRQAREAAERADLIVTVSAFTAAQVRDLLNVEPGRLRVVHHGVRVLPALQASAPAATREAVILSVGTIQQRKNTARLVRAFERLPEPWRLVLAGAPNGYGSEQAIEAVRSSPARHRIAVTGYVSPERLGALYASASVFAFPSLDEGFGMPVLEAMAYGVPVLAANRSALPEVCGDAALMVDPASEEEIGEGLLKLTSDEALRQSLATRGREHAATFTWEKAARQTWQAYEELF